MSQALIDLVREKFPEAVVSSHSHRGDEVVTVKRENIVEVIGFLRNDPQTDLKLLRQIAGVDLLTYRSEMSGGAALASIEVPAYDLQQAQGRAALPARLQPLLDHQAPLPARTRRAAQRRP